MANKVSTPLLHRRFHMGWAALVMGLSVLLSRFMGLIRDKVISYLFGATQESDLYFAAFVIPDFINYLLAGGYFSITLIPLLADYFARDEKEGWRFFSAAFAWVAVAITTLTLSSMVFAPQLARLTAPGLGEDALLRLAYFLRIILPAQVFFLLGSTLSAILYLRKQFVVPALTPLIYNLFIILGGVVLRGKGMEGFCWGVLLGALLGNFLLPLLAARQGGMKLTLSFRHSGLKRFVFLALPLMLGQSIVVLDEQLVRVFGSMAGAGSVSWLNYARRIMMVPVGVVAQAAGVASYPFLTELVARRDFPSFHRTLNLALRSVLTVLIPVSIWMILVAGPTVTLIFQQGLFDASDTQNTTRLLQIFLVVVFCWGVQQVLGRGFYARQDTLTPAIIGTVITGASLPIFWLLAKNYQAMGVATASATAIAAYMSALSCWWAYRFGGEAFRGLGAATLKLTVISLGSVLPGAFLMRIRFIDPASHPYWKSFHDILTSGLLFSLLFVCLSAYFIPSLIQPFLEKCAPLKRLLNRCFRF